MKTFLTIFNSLPAIVQSVQTIETIIPTPQAGKQKLDLILNSALSAWTVGQMEQQISQHDLVNSFTAITNLTVSTLNGLGLFKKQAAAPVSSK